MRRYQKYNDLAPAREEFDKFCLNHPCDKCPLYPLHQANKDNTHLGCFGSWLNEETDEDQTADGQEVKQSKRGTGDSMTKTYIDADELYKCEMCCHNRRGGCDIYCDHGENYRPSFDKFRKITDVPEVKHGKWKKYDYGSYIKICSVCGRKPLATPCGEPHYSYFCPHCGANMSNGR